MTESYLGNVQDAYRLTRAVVAHIEKWLETYLAPLEAERGWPARSLPVFRSYRTRNEVTQFAEEQLPACVVVSPGIVDGSIERFGGVYSAAWHVGIACMCIGLDELNSEDMAQVYTAAVRTMFLQHPAIKDPEDNSLVLGAVEEWLDEGYRDQPSEGDRTRNTGQVVFSVRMDNVLDAQDGLREPLEDPYQLFEHPVASETSIETTKLGDTE